MINRECADHSGSVNVDIYLSNIKSFQAWGLTTMFCRHLALNLAFVCVEAAKIPMSAADKMKIMGVSATAGG